MEIFFVGAVVLAAFFAFSLILVYSPALGGKTCRECGGGLPVIRITNAAENAAMGDWVCSKCGTRFNRQARVRQ